MVHCQLYHFKKKNLSLTKHCISVIQFIHSSTICIYKNGWSGERSSQRRWKGSKDIKCWKCSWKALWGKDEDIPEEVILAEKHFTSNGPSDIFHDIGRVRDKILAAAPHLECDSSPRHRKDLLELYRKLEDKEESTVQTYKLLLIKYLICQRFNVLRCNVLSIMSYSFF